jgi:hypothetical protein
VNTRKKRLSLKSSTLRALTGAQLERVAGGISGPMDCNYTDDNCGQTYDGCEYSYGGCDSGAQWSRCSCP